MPKIGRNRATNAITKPKNTVGQGTKRERVERFGATKTPTADRAARPTKTSGYDKLEGTKQRGEHYGHRPIVRGTMHRRAYPEAIQPGRTMLNAAASTDDDV